MDQEILTLTSRYLSQPASISLQELMGLNPPGKESLAATSPAGSQRTERRILANKYHLIVIDQDTHSITFRADDPQAPDHLDRAVQFDLSSHGSAPNTSFHAHDFVEFGFVLKGVLDIMLPDNKTAHLNAGDVVLMSHETRHAERYPDETATILYLQMTDSFFTSCMNFPQSPADVTMLRDLALEKKQRFQYVRFVPQNTPVQTKAVLKTILQELTDGLPGYADVITGQIPRLLYAVIREYDSMLSKEEEKDFRETLFHTIGRYITSNCQDMTVERLTEVFHYNPAFYTRLIREYTGLSYVQFLQNARLEKAEALLRATTLPVTDIAEQVGYQNMGHFYRLFTKRNGILPREYRQAARAGK